jgi:Uma2 family endonuclease
MVEYLENGAMLGFLIDRKQRQVHIYRPNQAPEILDHPDAVSGDPELPGFQLQMARIW